MTPAQRTEWNRQIVYWWYGHVETFEVHAFSDFHLRLTRKRDGLQMDYFPKTGKAVWLGFEKQTYFTIKDMEAYIQKMFL